MPGLTFRTPSLTYYRCVTLFCGRRKTVRIPRDPDYTAPVVVGVDPLQAARMPTRAPRTCPSCRRKITGTGPCQTCAQRRPPRASPAARGYGAAHRTDFRALVLERDPWCVICHRAPATVADHYPWSRRQLEAANLDPNDPRYGRGLCAPCHSTWTTQAQPGGWLRPEM